MQTKGENYTAIIKDALLDYILITGMVFIIGIQHIYKSSRFCKGEVANLLEDVVSQNMCNALSD